MTRTVLIGNSHLAALKQALEARRARDPETDLHIDTFGAHLNNFLETRLENGTIIPTTDRVKRVFEFTADGKSAIRLDEYDQLFAFMAVSPYYLPGYFPSFLVSPVSDTLLDQICRSWRELPLVNMIADIALACPDLQVSFVGQPFISESAPKARRMIYQALANPVDPTKLSAMRLRIKEMLQELVPSNMSVCHPPQACLDATGLFTLNEFSRGSQRLAETEIEHPEHDFVHMNADYGEAILSEIVFP